MAQIDVTDLLVDPDFVDKLTLVKRGAAVNSRGENMIKEVPYPTVGCVQPMDGNTLRRMPESLQNEDLSSFWLKGQFGLTDSCQYPSILVFKGRRYQVKKVFNWSNWGSGWTEGACVAENLA